MVKLSPTKFIGVLALEKGWINERDLKEALFVHKQTGEFVGTVLLNQKKIKKPQLSLLLDIQKEAAFREEDYLFGSIAVENKLIKAEDLMRALDAQKKDKFRKNIGETLFENGMLTEQECDSVLKVQTRLNTKGSSEIAIEMVVKCPSCTHKYNIKDPTRFRKIRCKKCKFAFEVGSKELEPTSSQMLMVQKDPDQVIDSTTNDFYHYLTENHFLSKEKELQDKLDGIGKQRYAVGKEIARGGMGAILTTFDLNLRRNIVTKVLLKNKSRLATLRFIEEAQITGQLEHPNIPPVYDLGVNNKNKLFFTMKHIKGETLESIINKLSEDNEEIKQAYDTNALINIFLKVCNALTYSHSKHVIHRDIKPENIMVGGYGEVLLMDWGLGKIIGSEEEVEEISGTSHQQITSARDDDDLSQTMEGTTAGTPAFMPPEQAKGHLNKLDERSDVYSLGATLYNTIALSRPFKGKSVHEVLKKVTSGKYRHMPKGIPVELVSIIEKAMAYKMRHRYQSIKELEEDLVKFQMGFSVSAKQDSPLDILKKFYKRNKTVCILIVASLLIIITGTISFAVMISSEINEAVVQQKAAVKNLKAANVALDQYESEKNKRQNENLKVAPSFYLRAQQDIENSKFKDALKNAKVAAEYDPSKVEYTFLRGCLNLLQEEFKNAAIDFKSSIKNNYKAASSKQLLKIIQAAEKKPQSFVGLEPKIASILADEKLFKLSVQFLNDVQKKILEWNIKIKQGRKRQFHSLLVNRDKEIAFRLGYLKKKKFDFSRLNGMKFHNINLASLIVGNLNWIKGMPLEDITLYNCAELKDYSPISEMRLKKFLIQGAKIKDVTFLQNSQLDKLDIQFCPVTTIESVRGQPIKTLKLVRTKIKNLDILKSFSLENLYLSNFVLKDFNSLKGLKVKDLLLSYCNVKDVSALASLPLEKLRVSTSQLGGLSFLKKLPLKSLSITRMKIKDFGIIIKIKTLEELTLEKGWIPKNWLKILLNHPNKNLKVRVLPNRTFYSLEELKKRKK